MVRMMTGRNEDDDDAMNMTMNKPAWLQGLMGETFFAPCGTHPNRRKNEKNIFCLSCFLSFCPHCLPSHRSHPLLQVRRYVYHDVVRLVDLQKLIDCSFIQPYTINGAKVIFLKQRAQSQSRVQSSRLWKGPPNVCFTCDRILQEPFHFCSLSCKVDHFMRQGEALAWITSTTGREFEGLRMYNNNPELDNEDDNEEEEDDDHEDMSHHHHDHHHQHDNHQIIMNSTTIPRSTSDQFIATSPPYVDPSSYYNNAEMDQYAAAIATNDVAGGVGGSFMKRKKKAVAVSDAGNTTTASGSSSSNQSGGAASRILRAFSLNSRRKGSPHRSPLS